MIASDVALGVVLLRQRFNVGDLTEVRELVHLTCIAAGLSAARADGFAASVNEAMTNAIVHGGPSRHVTVSMADGVGVRAEVSDDGLAATFDIPRGPPPVDQLAGRGLWIAAQLCDRVSATTGPRGTTVLLETDYTRGSG
jgi:anti-sigma regulatory factor (Ser/Thr protein kinase)